MPTSTKPRPSPVPLKVAALAKCQRRPLRNVLAGGSVARDGFHRDALAHARRLGLPLYRAVAAYREHLQELRAVELSRTRGLSMFEARILAEREARQGRFDPQNYRPASGDRDTGGTLHRGAGSGVRGV